MLEERDRLREVLKVARDSHAQEIDTLRGSLKAARGAAEEWQRACSTARSELATAEADLKRRRAAASKAAKVKRQASESFRSERCAANDELRRQQHGGGQSM